MTTTTTVDPRWAELAAPFPADQVEKLPKVMKREDQDKGSCKQGSRYSADGHYCGKWHARAVHLDYVGHAGITMRLNSVDPLWNWEPLAFGENGLPMFTPDGLWIKLTVLGVTRLGFGDAGTKRGADAVKEIIGDALRNAAMRFGVGTYLWSKSAYAEQLAAGEEPQAAEQKASTAPPLPTAKARAWTAIHKRYPEWTDDDCKSETVDELAKLGTDPAKATVEQWNAVAEIWEKAA